MQNDRPKLKPFKNVISEDDILTIPDLAMTPAQMMSLAENGIPISNQHLNNEYYDGDVNISDDIPLDRQRGVDVNEMWNKKQDVKKALKKMAKDDLRSRAIQKKIDSASEKGGN